MKFAVTVLGSGSAKPTQERLTSAQVLNVHEHFFLIDCGEGAQVSMLRNAIPMFRINHAFISHLHGDHYFGLIGLLNSMHLHSRKKDFHIWGFRPLKQIIEIQLEAAGTILSYPLHFHDLNDNAPELILDHGVTTVHSFPLRHRIPCCGFLFKEKKRSRNIKRDFVMNNDVPNEWFPRILNGEDYINENGKRFPNSEITHLPGTTRSYAYCSDTAFDESIVPNIKGVSLLYHEASFANDLENAAKEKFHSTAAQAATIANLAGAEQLMIGHFSSRYKTSEILLNEARDVFKNTIEAKDGLTIDV